MEKKQSLAKFCIRNGCPFVPAYSIGNSQAFNSWFDAFGVLEWLSRKTQCSLFLYWGCVCVCIVGAFARERGKMEEKKGRVEEFGEGKESWQLHIRLLVVVRSYT
jgi:hypothetical protein